VSLEKLLRLRGPETTKEMVEDLCNKLDPDGGYSADGGLVVTRMGRKPAPGEIGKSRAVKVTFADENRKMSVLKKAKNIRDLPGYQQKKVVVVPDKTLKEREKDKVLMAELKRRREEGEDVIIRGGAVILRPFPRRDQGGHRLAAAVSQKEKDSSAKGASGGSPSKQSESQ